MFWGVKLQNGQTKTIKANLILTNLCGIGTVRLNNIIIATLTSKQPQVLIDYKINGEFTLQSEGGDVDICGYYADKNTLDEQDLQQLSIKAQSMQNEEQLETIYKEQLRNIQKMLKK
ncbi:unnamed protein product [Paramecium primaurelia]|uniref:Uncharacterized protein n=1 Tax=Paramecium primaurelia TaxID=5886 RepID=A0A8S1QIR1_PARPR|nr:unnamed protein product [Paramecium primaurelia]